METLDSELFKEWLGLAGGPTPAADAPLGPDDALVVIDMQADFLPHDQALNPHGGRFGVPEGDHLVGTIVRLIDAATDAGVAPPLTSSQYVEMLLAYARQHTRSSAVNDTAQPAGSGHVFENLHPDLGYWNNRERMYWRDDHQRNMGYPTGGRTRDLCISSLY